MRAYDRHHGKQRYCVLCKKVGVPDRKYMSHITEDCADVRTKRSDKDGMGEYIGSRNHSVQQHKKSENKWKKELKALKKQNKMLYSIAKKSGSRREIQKIKKMKEESSKDAYSSSEDWGSDSLLASNSSWDKEIRPAGRK